MIIEITILGLGRQAVTQQSMCRSALLPMVSDAMKVRIQCEFTSVQLIKDILKASYEEYNVLRVDPNSEGQR